MMTNSVLDEKQCAGKQHLHGYSALTIQGYGYSLHNKRATLIYVVASALCCIFVANAGVPDFGLGLMLRENISAVRGNAARIMAA